MPAKGSILSTKQKRAVQAVIDGLDGPFTIQNVLAKLAESNSRVSRASAYRFVQSLCLSGQILPVMLPDGRRIFVRPFKGLAACIIECANCGKLSSYPAADLERSLCRRATASGWNLLQATTYARAICAHGHCEPRVSLR